MRRKIVFMLCLIMILASALPSLPVQAQTLLEPIKTHEVYEVEVVPFWQNIASIWIAPSFTNGRGVINGVVIANPGTTRISVNVILERVNPNGSTTHITSWNNLVANGELWAWEGVHFVARGHYYRTTLQVTALRNGVSETVTVDHTVWAN